nr:amylo-alpha-1,6-glucosidase [uncultured Sellimonas sp.]
MKWIYGKQDFKTLARGQENCYLLTNGLGGFSSLTMTGSAARNDHAFLMACTKAPNHRYNLVHRLKEEVTAGGEHLLLSTQEFADGRKEEGYRFLSSFTFDDTPVWRYEARGIQVKKEAGMTQMENTAAVVYEITNRRLEEAEFSVTPFLQFVRKGEDLTEDQTFSRADKKVTSNGMTLYVETDGEIQPEDQTETCYYSYDACDGRRKAGTAKAVMSIHMTVPAGEKKTLSIVFSMEQGRTNAGEIIAETKRYRKALEERAGFSDPMARVLSKSAAQFVAERESTGGKTILAGFPFFEDWGRDTMIALPGVCISTGQYETAREILRTFAANERDGLMPNLFPEGQNEPRYNTVDAALLFINCVYLYHQAAGDMDFVREVWPVMERVIAKYKEGTRHGIRMDEDGLIRAGEGLDQVTWMDVRVGEILPTPRHGKPVEINAYWYNALRIMETFASELGLEYTGYGVLADKVSRSFREQFWNEEKGCLKDLVSGTKADGQIRCNQIWAVSMPFTMLEKEQEQQVVRTVYEKLYTPYGLRTLEEGDEEFHPFYGGEMVERDLAYHQGTVWTFPLGAYYLAYLKVCGYSEEAKAEVREHLEVMESAMREGCIGQLPEIYDGDNPSSSKGCFAQAWSVGEILRVYEAVE